MRVLVAAIVAAAVFVVPARLARAEPLAGSVALLPLDADPQLEIYGQPVAGEIARALVSGSIKVVIVGPKMAVPEGVLLVVDGTIKAGKGDAVLLTARVRDPRDGTVIDTLAATAASRTAIDQAAEELSGRVVPSVRGRLATLESHRDPLGREPKPPPKIPAALPAVDRPMLVTVFAVPGETSALQGGLDGAVTAWAHRHHHEAKLVESTALLPDNASKRVVADKADFALLFEVLAFDVAPGPIPTARATVRVRIADPGHTVFDRVVVTDTVVGDHGLAPAMLAERVGREVLSIIEPHLKRSVASWR